MLFNSLMLSVMFACNSQAEPSNTTNATEQTPSTNTTQSLENEAAGAFTASLQNGTFTLTHTKTQTVLLTQQSEGVLEGHVTITKHNQYLCINVDKTDEPLASVMVLMYDLKENRLMYDLQALNPQLFTYTLTPIAVSPDGLYIAFSEMNMGGGNLSVIYLETGKSDWSIIAPFSAKVLVPLNPDDTKKELTWQDQHTFVFFDKPEIQNPQWPRRLGEDHEAYQMALEAGSGEVMILEKKLWKDGTVTGTKEYIQIGGF